MDSSDIIPGRKYAYRSNPHFRDPFQRIEATEKVTTSRGKWQVRFLNDPYSGDSETSSVAIVDLKWKYPESAEPGGWARAEAGAGG